MKNFLKAGGLIFLFLLMGLNSFSTHLKAGEIIVNRISPTQFEIKLYIYTDSTSVVAFGVDEPDATLKFSDGTSMTVNRDPPGRIYIGNATFKNVYTFIRSFNNSTYTISYQRENRNAGILNMDNSGNTPFYVETIIKVSPFIGVDNLPSLLIPPIDIGDVGQKYIHNPGAFDPEGDSISYELAIPKQNSGVNVAGYANPNIKPSAGGSFSLNPVTGDLVWDAPLVAGLYNVAILIKEWRNGQVIGSIVRDMQIKIEDTQDKRPILQIPKDTCIEAGTVLNFIPIVAIDPDNNKINLTSASGLYSLSSSPAKFTLSFLGNNPLSSPASGKFDWATNCSHIRDEPYQVIFKAEDLPSSGPKLFDLRSWNIRVLAPAPQGLKVKTINKGFQLDWNSYACSNAGKMEIYRKVCDSSDVVVSPCDNEIFANSGYTKIGEVPIGVLSFKDTVNINPGSFYYYKISAAFPAPKGGKSYASAGVFGKVLGVPVPTNVTVIKTDSVNGKIMVNWTKPQDLDTVAFPGPYQYKLYRAKGITGTNYSLVATLSNLTDTVVIDSLINTRDTSYNYKLEFYYSNSLTLKNTSISASSVFLSSTSGGNKVTSKWTYNDPWNNKNEYHRIYKANSSGIFVLSDSVFVTGGIGSYIEYGLTNNDTVCYYIETQGRYCSDDLPHPLINKSQIVCAVPRDTLPPCAPLLFGLKDCIEDGITHLTINWLPDYTSGCNKDIQGYNVYYAEHEDEELQLLARNVADTFFVDIDNFSLAGCYAVTALNFYGIESVKSNKVCVDICVYYELPNLITPNRDNLNDIFKAYPVPKNVEQVQFSVFNRWGKRVYYSEDNIHLNWPGISSDGSNLPSGVYYFLAEVKYKRRLNKADQFRTIKGWINLIRKDEEFHE